MTTLANTMYHDPVQAASAMKAALAQAHNILVLSHINPDGDAIGSALGLCHVLRAMGKEATTIASSDMPGYVSILPGIEGVGLYTPGAALPPADLIIVVDTANLARISPRFYEEHHETLARRPLIVIDHHVTNPGEGQLNLIGVKASSCAELLVDLLQAMNAPISPDAATCFLMGIVTDTNSFRTSTVTANTHHIAGQLVALGANQEALVNILYNAMPLSTLHLVGLGLSNMHLDGDILWTSLTQDMLHLTGAEDEASDDLIRMMQTIEGPRLFALFKERADGSVKLSLRSKSPVNVANIAKTWGGGGHSEAAGANLPVGLAAAPEEVLPKLKAALQAL